MVGERHAQTTLRIPQQPECVHLFWISCWALVCFLRVYTHQYFFEPFQSIGFQRDKMETCYDLTEYGMSFGNAIARINEVRPRHRQ